MFDVLFRFRFSVSDHLQVFLHIHVYCLCLLTSCHSSREVVRVEEDSLLRNRKFNSIIIVILIKTPPSTDLANRISSLLMYKCVVCEQFM